MTEYELKRQKLLACMEQYAKEDVVVAFSGGVDSSLLLKLACEAAKNTTVYAVTIQSELQPQNDLEIAKTVAMEMGAKHVVLTIHELREAGIQTNPKDRCYLCKKYLFGQIRQFAAQKGITQILEGTNEEDLHKYRPGIRAIRELGIFSPLAAVGMTKEEVRTLANEYGISVANRPSAPCLATRFPYGTMLSLEALTKVEQAEQYLRALGFRNIRVRVYGEIVRIEVGNDQLMEAVAKRENINSYFKTLGYHYITLDLEGFRSGSMDEQIPVIENKTEE